MAGRTLHYVIRCTDLKKGLGFLEGVLGMKVLRHEENAEACPIACNGKYNNAWSKTMIGYDGNTEDKHYCLEVVYNYGVPSYPTPSGLRSIHIAPRDPPATLAKAEAEGYAVSGNTIAGPDGYAYVVETAPGRQEPFWGVTVAVKNLEASLDWYTKVWGFTHLGDGALAWERAEGCGEAVPLRLVEDKDAKVDPQIDGRHAVALPTADLKERYARIEKDFAGNIVFPMRVLAEDKLGALYLAITKDPDGHELCTVSKETFDPAVANPPYNYPDWAHRAKFEKEGTASLVKDEKTGEGREIDFVDEDSWEAVVGAEKLTLAWFTADWCAPCKKARPDVEKLAGLFGDRGVHFVKVNVDEAPDLVEEAEVTRPPTFQLWRAGAKLRSFEGADKIGELTEYLTQTLG
eukprot:Hpha_TRINITY_DN15390_c1_g4::TRINITY_DN15390_c1_g4_i1::g.92077::m.92077